MTRSELLNKSLPSPMSHGGSAGKSAGNKMILAHFSKPEIQSMNYVQGKEVKDKYGIPDFSELGKFLDHPHMANMLHHHARYHFATGGHVKAELERMAHHGRYGDTEVAAIPESLAHRLDTLIGGRKHNPYDNKPEYFLGDLFGSLGTTLAKSAAPAAASAATSAASNPSSWGSMLANMGSSLAKGASSAAKTYGPGMLKGAGELAKAAAPVAAQYGMQYMQNKMNPQQAQPMDYSQMFNDVTGAMAPQFGEGMAGRAFEGARRGIGSMLEGNDWRTGMANAINAGTEGYDNPYAAGLRGAANAYADSGGDYRKAIAGGVNEGTSGRNDMYSRAARGAANSYARPGSSFRDVAADAMDEGLEGMDSPYAQTARTISRGVRRGSNLRDMGMDAMDTYGRASGNQYAKLASAGARYATGRNSPPPLYIDAEDDYGDPLPIPRAAVAKPSSFRQPVVAQRAPVRPQARRGR